MVGFYEYYLNNRLFLSRYYQLILAQQKFHVLKTTFCLRSEAWRATMLVVRTSNFQGAPIGLIFLKHKHSFVFIVHHKIFFSMLVLLFIKYIS